MEDTSSGNGLVNWVTAGPSLSVRLPSSFYHALLAHSDCNLCDLERTVSTPFNQPSSSKLDPFTFLSSGSTPKQNVELQLKGSGRTPFSRFADGLAVLRSSIREFLGAEGEHPPPPFHPLSSTFQSRGTDDNSAMSTAMAALKIPTSRTLSLISLPDVKVLREKVEKAAIVCRVAPSWIRIGVSLCTALFASCLAPNRSCLFEKVD